MKRSLRENAVTEIILALDGDARGQEAADALASRLREMASLVKTVHRVTWPEGVKDANDFFLSHSAEDFSQLSSPAVRRSVERRDGWRKNHAAR